MAEQIVLRFTKSEVGNLADFIEFNIFNIIRDDTDIDGIGWLCDMTNIYQKLVKAGVKGVEDNG